MDKRQILIGMVILTSIFILSTTSVRAQFPNCFEATGCHEGWDVNLSVFSGSSSIHRDINNDGASNASDCQACHNNGSGQFTEARMNIGGFTVPTYYCKDCHFNATPPISGAPQIYEHQDNSSDVNTTATCWGCHVNNILSATYSNGDIRAYNKTISNVAHYGIRPTLDTRDCKACHTNAATGATWGNATQVNSTTPMAGGYPITSSTTSADCRRCHGDVSATNFHNQALNRSSFGTSSDCKACHFSATQQTTFTNSEHGTRECTLCKNTAAPMNVSLVKRCGSNGACHNLTSSSYDDHSKKEIKCVGCHGSDYHGVGKFKQACEVCHDKEKHVRFERTDPYNATATFYCVTCHSEFHAKDINEPGCTTCHDIETLPSTGDVCEKCHGSLHEIHVVNQSRGCTECHSNLHEAPREVNCRKCHGMVKKERIDEILIPHTDCRDCHEHWHKPTELFPFCSNCHEQNEQGRMHNDTLWKDIHTEVTKARKTCTDCHEQGVDKKPRCTTCHNVHIIHKEEKTCVGCHGLLGGERTHYRILCDTCHQTEGERGASMANLLPEKVSVGITRPQDCESCHKYKRKDHGTCQRCHGEKAPEGVDLSSFASISKSGKIIYTEESDANAANYLREGTDLKVASNITAKERYPHLYNNITLYWYGNVLSFSEAGRFQINVTPYLALENVTVGTITNDTGDQYLVVEIRYPDVKMRPLIQKTLIAQSEFDTNKSTTFEKTIKMLYAVSGNDYTLHIIDGDEVEGHVNIANISAKTDISAFVHEISDVLDGYDVFLIENATSSNAKIAISDKSKLTTITDEQKDVLGYEEAEISEVVNGSNILFRGTEVAFVKGKKQKITPTKEYFIILGGPVKNPVAAIENSKANIFFNVTENKTELTVEREKYACESQMWQNEDYAVLKIMEETGESVYVYVEGCTRYGTEAAAKMLKSGDVNLKGKTTAILHWKDINYNKAVELNEVLVYYAF